MRRVRGDSTRSRRARIYARSRNQFTPPPPNALVLSVDELAYDFYQQDVHAKMLGFALLRGEMFDYEPMEWYDEDAVREDEDKDEADGIDDGFIDIDESRMLGWPGD